MSEDLRRVLDALDRAARPGPWAAWVALRAPDIQVNLRRHGDLWKATLVGPREAPQLAVERAWSRLGWEMPLEDRSSDGFRLEATPHRDQLVRQVLDSFAQAPVPVDASELWLELHLEASERRHPPMRELEPALGPRTCIRFLRPVMPDEPLWRSCVALMERGRAMVAVTADRWSREPPWLVRRDSPQRDADLQRGGIGYLLAPQCAPLLFPVMGPGVVAPPAAAKPADPEPPTLARRPEVEARVTAILAEPEHYQRYDLNGDGVVDAGEKDRLRRLVAAQLKEEAHRAAMASAAPVSAPDAPLLRQRYQVLRELGRGGQARTLLARDTVTDTEIVLKHLALAEVDSWKAVELFEREAAALRALDHPAIPSYVDLFHIAPGDGVDDPPGFYLAQEFVEGESLAAGLARGDRLTEDEVRDVMGQVLDVLEYLHGRNPPVIHRDIKPSNLMRRPDGRIALIDFGAIQSILPASQRAGSTVVGTYGYMAPEQFMGRAAPATDLYGLGATAVHLLSHTHPADLPMSRMALLFHDVVRISGPLRDVLDQLLAPTIEDRLQTAALAREALAGLSRPPPVAPPPRPPPLARPAPARDAPGRPEPGAVKPAQLGVLGGLLDIVFGISAFASPFILGPAFFQTVSRALVGYAFLQLPAREPSPPPKAPEDQLWRLAALGHLAWASMSLLGVAVMLGVTLGATYALGAIASAVTAWALLRRRPWRVGKTLARQLAAAQLAGLVPGFLVALYVFGFSEDLAGYASFAVGALAIARGVLTMRLFKALS